MYESSRQPLLGRRAFLRRLLGHLATALLLVPGSIAIGMAGYMRLEGLVFVATAALVLGPLVHRVLHRFHLDRE